MAKEIIRACKIRDRNTGLFSTGGCEPQFTKNGKTWSTEGQCKAHLTMFKEYKKKIPDSWEVVMLTYVLDDEKTLMTAKELADREPKK